MTAGRYSGRVAIVTGARRGVGRIIAEHLLAEGATVVGLARGDATITHPAYRHAQVDVTDSAAVAKAVRGVAKEHGGIDLVINNAAVLTSQYAMIMPAENAQAMVLTNLLAPFVVAREAAKVMRKARAGRIINVGSMAASLEPVGDSIYAACKAALTTLSGVLAKEFGSFGVTVNTVAITAIETDMLAQLPRDKIDAIVAALPIARYAVADDICNVVDFFADDRSSYITAQTLYLGGVH
jgi:3-oxoacyl-[acyl-carrier protein] reductase